MSIATMCLHEEGGGVGATRKGKLANSWVTSTDFEETCSTYDTDVIISCSPLQVSGNIQRSDVAARFKTHPTTTCKWNCSLSPDIDPGQFIFSSLFSYGGASRVIRGPKGAIGHEYEPPRSSRRSTFTWVIKTASTVDYWIVSAPPTASIEQRASVQIPS